MHICCANCAIRPLGGLMEAGHEMTGLWFNPNIHPEDEYEKRMSAVRELSGLRGLPLIKAGGYGRELFDRAMEASSKRPDGTARPARCAVCYSIRMRETARQCALGGFEAFTTSLLISPYQEHALLIETAREAAREHGARFYYEDFRPLWREGQALSREAGFYRQYYCGCHFSKAERDMERAERARQNSGQNSGQNPGGGP